MQRGLGVRRNHGRLSRAVKPGYNGAMPNQADTRPVLRRAFERCAVIGDIHGRADLLAALLDRLPPDLPILVVGDLCDRGPDTKGVLDLLVARGARGVVGNHDEWLRQWARGDGLDRMALSPMMSGRATLKSYGVTGESDEEIGAESWRVPVDHRDFLNGLAIAIDLDVGGVRYWVVHAGVPSTESMKGLPAEEIVPHLANESPASLLWSFVDPHEALRLDRPIIHGHSPRTEPLDTGDVLAIDTGCGTLPNGRLTAVVLPERRFISVGEDDARVPAESGRRSSG